MMRVALTVAAVGVFLGSWSLLHHGPFARSLISDTGLYEQYGDGMARGQVPYRDFRLEYPPGALPVFVLPSLGHEGDRVAYDRWFDRLMALCGCIAVAGVGLALAGLGAGLQRTALALGVVAVSPLLVGPVVLSRFDLWPGALAVLAVALLVWDELLLAAVLLGAAIAAKLWPAVMAPVVLAWIWNTRGPKVALRWAAAVVAVDAAIFVPFALLGPSGLGHSFHAQLSRPLQLESLGGAVLIAVHRVFGTQLHVYTTMSQNLSGPGTHAAELATTAVQVVAIAALWTVFARGYPSRERLVAYAAASVAAFVAFAKVFSPQFIIWLIPLVPLASRRLATAALVAALALTGLYFPRHYWRLAGLDSPQSWELLARDLLVVAVAVLLAVEPRRQRAE
jgi:Glycosyltransferase family 87